MITSLRTVLVDLEFPISTIKSHAVLVENERETLPNSRSLQ
jgi:hypothetical protein